MQKQETAVQNTIKKRIPYFIIVGLILSIGSIAFFFLTKGDSKTSVLVSSDPSSKTTGSISVTQDASHLSNSKEAREAPLCSTLSPFQSGQVNCREEIKKKLFLKPNTEWKTRTINGITYVFGEGNPKEVAKNRSELRPVDEYVTPEVEYALKAFLEDENFTKVMQKCGHILDWENKLEKPDWEKYPDNLDMETMLIINPEHGRKEINGLFLHVIEPRLSFLRSPVGDPRDPLRLCLGEDYSWMESVFRNMNNLTRSYIVN